MQETQEMRVRSLSGKDFPEVGMATTPVFLPGEFHGQRSLAGYSPRGHTEPDMTRGTVHTHISKISKSGNKIKKKRKDHVVKKSRLRTATIPRYKTDS